MRTGVLLAGSTSLLTLVMFAAVAKVVSQDHGWLTASDVPSTRVAQVHGDADRNPWQSSEHSETAAPRTRVALAHAAVMEKSLEKNRERDDGRNSPWLSIGPDP